jgi:hypothetical protein
MLPKQASMVKLFVPRPPAGSPSRTADDGRLKLPLRVRHGALLRSTLVSTIYEIQREIIAKTLGLYYGPAVPVRIARPGDRSRICASGR